MTDLSRDPLEASFDRFTLPGEIPDAAYWAGDATLEQAQARAAAGRREDAAARGYTPSHPAGRGWVPDSRDSALPLDRRAYPRFEHDGVEHIFTSGTPADLIEKIGAGQVFTRERRVRFLDNLAFKGNVRAAAALVGVSHETAYRARRRDALFARLWDAAMVHARTYAESVIATRAIDGVEVPIVLKGEVVGFRTVHDVRWMNAHTARLDRRVESDPAAVALADRFDEALGAYAGEAMPAAFPPAPAEDDGLPPARGDYLARATEAVLDELDAEDWSEAGEDARETAEAELTAEAADLAGAEWDEFQDRAFARLDAIVAPEGKGEGDDAPPEFKSAHPPHAPARQRVTPVNPPARGRRAALLQTAASPAAHSPYIRGVVV